MITPDSNRSTQHLTGEQFTGLAIGEPIDAAGRAHLAACDRCRQELARFAASVDLFSGASLAWSSARPVANSAASPAPRPARAALAPLGWPLGWALALAALLLAVLPMWRQRPGAPAARGAIADSAGSDSGRSNSAGADSSAEIAQDNRLLESVAIALNAAEDSPLPEVRLAGGAARTGAPGTGAAGTGAAGTAAPGARAQGARARGARAEGKPR